MIKFTKTLTNKLVVTGELKSIDKEGMNFESEGKKEKLEFSTILENFKDIEVNITIKETKNY